MVSQTDIEALRFNYELGSMLKSLESQKLALKPIYLDLNQAYKDLQRKINQLTDRIADGDDKQNDELN